MGSARTPGYTAIHCRSCRRSTRDVALLHASLGRGRGERNKYASSTWWVNSRIDGTMAALSSSGTPSLARLPGSGPRRNLFDDLILLAEPWLQHVIFRACLGMPQCGLAEEPRTTVQSCWNCCLSMDIPGLSHGHVIVTSLGLRLSLKVPWHLISCVSNAGVCLHLVRKRLWFM